MMYEQEMIIAYETRVFGYNLTDGGEGSLGAISTHEKIAKKLGARPFVVVKNNVVIGTWTNMSA